MQKTRKIQTICLLFSLVLLLASLALPAAAATDAQLDNTLTSALTQLATDVSEPNFGTFTGEWSVLCLARGEYYAQGDAYFESYYARIVATVNETAPTVSLGNGALHKAKSTENSRLILALSAIGKDATTVGEWNLITPYDDFNWIKKQGINGPIFALIALDTNDYQTGDPTIRRQCVDFILSKQLDDGGWALNGTVSDPDITAMALQSLYRYREQEAVEAAAQEAFAWLSGAQRDDGSYSSWGTVNSESIAQVIVAATRWGIDPNTDSRFVKDGGSAVDALLRYYVAEESRFRHIMEGDSDPMATDQACYALIAYRRFLDGKTALYDMSDVTIKKSCYGEHAWDDGVVTAAPTCKTEGSRTYTCLVCGETKALAIARSTEHGATELRNATAATCTEDGYTGDVYCTVCDELLSKGSVIESKGHEETSVAAVDATCENTGLSRGTKCAVCGAWIERQSVIVPLGHEDADEDGACDRCGTDMSSVCTHEYDSLVTAPSCTEDGYTTYTCSKCGHSYQSNPTEATGHSWDDGVVTTAPTCKDEGTRTYTCLVCGESKTEAIEKTALHVPGDAPTLERGQYCTLCGKLLQSALTPSPLPTVPDVTEPEQTMPNTTTPLATEPEQTVPDTTAPEGSVPAPTEPAATSNGGTTWIIVAVIVLAIAGTTVALLVWRKKK